jgi:hypothetical protein
MPYCSISKAPSQNDRGLRANNPAVTPQAHTCLSVAVISALAVAAFAFAARAGEFLGVVFALVSALAIAALTPAAGACQFLSPAAFACAFPFALAVIAAIAALAVIAALAAGALFALAVIATRATFATFAARFGGAARAGRRGQIRCSRSDAGRHRREHPAGKGDQCDSEKYTVFHCKPFFQVD